ncbi:hypothetical protein D9619_011036 [Psilocybe cf. subviscida]|uniref:Uncharacterized protein n=1 Tax=Psilocybe cf. subviscida TaxID=2480587 RepID=A0A8H5B8J3_9AGAR|nr:hypothetical protein D9619_011036 [Psilocybe cf. subviscida]
MASSSSNTNTASARTPNVLPLLLCETLGFFQQHHLDDITNVANNAVQDGVNGMEESLNKWADERVSLETTARKAGSRTTSIFTPMRRPMESSRVPSHSRRHWSTTPITFLISSKRGISEISSCLHWTYLPHQAGLDLTVTPEKEPELTHEVEELKKQLDGPLVFSQFSPLICSLHLGA